MATTPATVRIATRESQLALAQSRGVARALEARYPALAVELVPMTTKGDRVLDRPLAQVGGRSSTRSPLVVIGTSSTASAG